MTAFCHPWEYFPKLHCYIVFVRKERSEIFVEVNFGHFDILEVLQCFLPLTLCNGCDKTRHETGVAPGEG